MRRFSTPLSAETGQVPSGNPTLLAPGRQLLAKLMSRATRLTLKMPTGL